MRPTRLRLAALLLAVASSALGEENATPRIYRWIDENGIAHYTTNPERVPEELRDQPLRREQVSAQAPALVDAWVQRERIPEPPAPDAGAPQTAATGQLAALDERIAALEQEIAADEALLKGDLTGGGTPASNQALEEVAERMPARLAELNKLKAERDALSAPRSE